MARGWYVINTYSGYENKVKLDLENRVRSLKMEDKIHNILIPSEEVHENKGGKKKVSTRRYFPGYILVEMDLTDETYHFICETPKVTSFVGSGHRPTALTPDEVDNILGQMKGTKSRPKPKVDYVKDETVKVTEGPFANFSGRVEEINMERGKIKVMVTIFGRPTPVELEFGQVEREA